MKVIKKFQITENFNDKNDVRHLLFCKTLCTTDRGPPAYFVQGPPSFEFVYFFYFYFT